MNELSKSGMHYLKEYKVLEEARNDVEIFLDTIAENIYSNLEENLDRINLTDFEINLYIKQKSKGHIRIEFKCRIEKEKFRKDASDINVIYKDIRNTNIEKSTACKVYAWSPNIASHIQEELSQKCIEQFDRDIYEEKIIEFELDDTLTSAEEISNSMLEITDIIAQFLKEQNG